MRQLVAPCAIAIMFAIGSSTPAHASGIGVVAVTGPHVDRGAVARAMAAAIGRPDLVEDATAEARAAVAAGAVPIATLERFRAVREAIDDGWRAFVRVQAELAVSRLSVARTDAEALVAYPGGAALYADASLRLGAVLDHLGRKDEARAAVALALALDPERAISIAEFSPDVVSLVDAVRAEPRTNIPASVTTEPFGANVAIDGKPVGKAPVAAELSIGQHVVVASAPRYEPQARAFSVAAITTGATVRDLTMSLARDPASTALAEGASIGLSSDSARELVESTLRFADLDEVVLVAATDRRGGPALLVQRCAGIPVRCTALVEVGYAAPSTPADASGAAAAAREAWQATRSADLRYPPTVFADAASTSVSGDDRCHVCRSPYLWGGIGAAAAITTIVVIAVLSGSRPPPTVAVDPSSF